MFPFFEEFLVVFGDWPISSKLVPVFLLDLSSVRGGSTRRRAAFEFGRANRVNRANRANRSRSSGSFNDMRFVRVTSRVLFFICSQFVPSSLVHSKRSVFDAPADSDMGPGARCGHPVPYVATR